MTSSCCGPSSGRDSSDSPAGPVSADAATGVVELVEIPGGPFLMGSDDPLSYPADGEGPVREVHVAPFSIGRTTVTVAEFASFIDDTGYRTDAEVHGDSLVFASLVSPQAEPRGAVAATPWWYVVPGAWWLEPEGPGSGVDDRLDHPVTHVSQRDAQAFARWAGGRLPTEAEWEFAARGGLVQQPYPWGEIREPGGEPRMNIFEGSFPDGPTSPVGTVSADAFTSNAFGLFTMTGNVWEWTSSTFGPHDPRPVLRGGSYLCHDSYCRRYRTSARSPNTPDTSLGHTGFRLAADPV